MDGAQASANQEYLLSCRCQAGKCGESIVKLMKKPLLFLFIVIKYNYNKERGGLVWLMQ